MTAATSDRRLTLSEVAKLRPGRGGKPLSPATLTRWILAGVTLPDGTRLKLRAERVGSRWETTAEWFAEFIEKQTAAFVNRDAAETAPPPPSPAARNRAADAASRELELMGC